MALIRKGACAFHGKGSAWEAALKPCLPLLSLLPPPSLKALLSARSPAAYFSKISGKCKCPCPWSRAQKDCHACCLKLKLAFSFFCRRLFEYTYSLQTCSKQMPLRKGPASCLAVSPQPLGSSWQHRLSEVIWFGIKTSTPSTAYPCDAECCQCDRTEIT